MAVNYLERSVEPLLRSVLDELPGVLLVGPRASGKTTTAARLAASVVRLDRPAEAAVFQADPDAALRGLEEPVLVDEWQVVPEVLGALKRSIDADPRPGRYLVTGSVRADLEAATWPGTGRLVRVPLYPLTVGEQAGRPHGPPLIDRLARGAEITVPQDTPDLGGYVDIALRGGFPEASLGLSPLARQHWFDSYVDQLLTRDVDLVDAGRDPARLRRYFEAYAVNSAGLVEDKTIYDAAGINRRTGLAYEQLLTNLMVVDTIPAWFSNRLKRVGRTAKRHLVDPALLAGILRVESGSVMRDGDLLGRLLDTFVTAQLRVEMTTAAGRPRLYHLRQEQGRHEVDLLVELGGGRVIGIEVKSDSAPTSESARHLVWLRERLGDRFVAGVVLHTGPRVYRLGDQVLAAPISTLWA